MNDAEAIAVLRDYLTGYPGLEPTDKAHEALLHLEASRFPTSGAWEPTPMIREPLSPQSFAAASAFHSGAIESAEDFARRLGGPEFEWSITPAIAAIEARDSAIATAAKLEGERAMLERLTASTNEKLKGKGLSVDPCDALAAAFDEAREAAGLLRSKLTAEGGE